MKKEFVKTGIDICHDESSRIKELMCRCGFKKVVEPKEGKPMKSNCPKCNKTMALVMTPIRKPELGNEQSTTPP